MAISVENYLHCCRICLGLEKSDYFLDIDSTQLPEADVSVQTALLKTTGVEVSGWFLDKFIIVLDTDFSKKL